MNWKRRLDKALQSRTLALFVGADLPSTVTGVPSRAELARGMAQEYHQDTSLSLADVSQRLLHNNRRGLVTRYLVDALDPFTHEPQPFHQQLVALVTTYDINFVITSAYDDLLQQAFRQAQQPVYRVVNDDDLHLMAEPRPAIVKLYGDIQLPSSLVVTDQDHSHLLEDPTKQALVDEVRRTFRRNTILIVGYDLADPDFRFIFDRVAQNRFARTALAIWPGMPQPEIQMWQERGIIILDSDPLGTLKDLAAPEENLPSPVPAPSGKGNQDNEVESQTDQTGEVDGGWNRAAMRQLISQAFDVPTLTTFIYDYFPDVHEQLSPAMGKSERIQRLMEFCYRQRQTDRLRQLIKQHNPDVYLSIEDRTRT